MLPTVSVIADAVDAVETIPGTAQPSHQSEISDGSPRLEPRIKIDEEFHPMIDVDPSKLGPGFEVPTSTNVGDDMVVPLLYRLDI